jgi:hypothetical protein
MFVVSASHEMMDYKARATSEHIPILAYYDKLTAANPEKPAWVDIQRWVLAKTFGEESDIARSLGSLSTDDANAIDVMNETLCRLQLPIRTYIQDLGAKVSAAVLRPIEVICVARGAASIDAYAPSLALPTHGRGEDVIAAVEDLRQIILVQTDALLREKEENLSDYAKKVMERIGEYIALPEEE